MSGLASALVTMTPQEYFAFEETTPLKHEYLDGVIYAMVGATDRHNLIAGNIFAALRVRRPPGCQVFTMAMKLRVKSAAGEFYYYPDVLVSCSEVDRDRLFREQPVLLIEVASPSTLRIDRGEKLNNYRQVPSLVEYAIIHQDQPLIEAYRRRNDWSREVLKPDQDLVLESVGVTLSQAEVYDEISF